jgi:hypothetical protein
LIDETGSIFIDSSLPDISVLSNSFTIGFINIGYDVDGGLSGSQTGIITSVIPEPSTYALLLISAAGALCCARRHHK